MARYAYPLRRGRTENIIGVATSTDNADDLVAQFADTLASRHASGDCVFIPTHEGTSLERSLQEDGSVDVLLKCYDQNERQSEDDERLLVSKLPVNEIKWN